MPNKMLIDASHPEETRVVVVRGNRIEEFDFESQDKKQLKGNIYLARVTRVEPSLQAAFVEYGGNRHGFLAFSEIHPDYYQIPVADRQALLRAEAEEAEAEDDEDGDGDERRTAAATAAGAAAARTAAATTTLGASAAEGSQSGDDAEHATTDHGDERHAEDGDGPTSIDDDEHRRATVPTQRRSRRRTRRRGRSRRPRIACRRRRAKRSCRRDAEQPTSAATSRHRRSPQPSTAT